MPLVQINVSNRLSTEYQETISNVIYQAMTPISGPMSSEKSTPNDCAGSRSPFPQARLLS